MTELTTELKAVEQQLLELGDKFLAEMDKIIEANPNEVLTLFNMFEQEEPRVEFSIPVIESLYRCYNLKKYVAFINRKKRLHEAIEIKQTVRDNITSAIATQHRLLDLAESMRDYYKVDDEVAVLRDLEDRLTAVETELESLYNQVGGKIAEVR